MKNKSIELILKVQSNGKPKRYRLGVNVQYSKMYFKKRRVKVILFLSDGIRVETKTTCGNSNFSKKIDDRRKKGYDLYDKEINQWILDNNYHIYTKGYPTRLKFELESLSPLTLVFKG